MSLPKSNAQKDFQEIPYECYRDMLKDYVNEHSIT